jgi:hypothetical protein
MSGDTTHRPKQISIGYSAALDLVLNHRFAFSSKIVLLQGFDVIEVCVDRLIDLYCPTASECEQKQHGRKRQTMDHIYYFRSARVRLPDGYFDCIEEWPGS